MSIKEKIYAVCVENKLLKKIYISISYIKWKIYYKINLVNPIKKYKKSTKNPVFFNLYTRTCKFRGSCDRLCRKHSAKESRNQLL